MTSCLFNDCVSIPLCSLCITGFIYCGRSAHWCAAYQEELFQVVLDVLALNSEHGSGHLVDGCCQAVDVVVVACEDGEVVSESGEWKRLPRGCFLCVGKRLNNQRLNSSQTCRL